MNMNVSLQYCVMCEKMVYVLGDFHVQETRLMWDGSPDYVVCNGPFATCPPPELEEDWNVHLTPPSRDEIAQMDENASEVYEWVYSEAS